MGPRFGVLRSVLGESGTTPVNQSARVVPVLRLLGSTGGSGVTSLLAGLARHMAGIGEGALIIDADPESPLPFHFGFSHLQDSPGLKTAVIPGTRPVFVLKRHNDQASSPAEARCTWLEEGLAPLRHCLDRILVDGTPRFWECLPPVEFDHALNLVVLTPDLNSLSRLDGILKRLAGQPALFLLNKFDGNNSLHEQVRLWLQRKLGERLLSITIRRTDEVPEALADGVTVLDYAPAASISEDYRELCAILRQWDGTNIPSIHNAAAEISA